MNEIKKILKEQMDGRLIKVSSSTPKEELEDIFNYLLNLDNYEEDLGYCVRIFNKEDSHEEGLIKMLELQKIIKRTKGIL